MRKGLCLSFGLAFGLAHVLGIASALSCPGLSLTVPNPSHADWQGNKLTIKACNGSFAQQFDLYQNTSSALEFCIDNVTISMGLIINVQGGVASSGNWFINDTRNDTAPTIISGSAPFQGGFRCQAACPSNWTVQLNSTEKLGGWNGAKLSIMACDGSILVSNLMLPSQTLGGYDVCVPALTNYIVKVDTVTFPNPAVSWALKEPSGNRVVSGGAPFFGHSGCSEAVCGNDWKLELHDSFGDGWNGNRMEVYDCSMNPVGLFTLDSGRRADFDLCLPPNSDMGYTFRVLGGTWQNEVSWRVVSGNNTQLLTGGAPFSGSLNCTKGCTGRNWDIQLTADSAGWQGAMLNVFNCDRELLAANITLESGGLGHADVCLDTLDGVYITVTGGVYPNSIGWTLRDSSSAKLLGGSAPFYGYTNCTKSPCQSRVYAELVDKYGDGWNGNKMDFFDCETKKPLAVGVTLLGGKNRSAEVCLPGDSDSFIVSVGGGLYQNEVAWTLRDSNATALLYGGAPYYGNVNCASACTSEQDWSIILTSNQNGWGGAEMTITTCNDTLLATNISLASGKLGGASVCLSSASNYRISVTAAANGFAPSWILLSPSGDRVLAGGAPFTGDTGCPARPCLENELQLSYTNFFGQTAVLDVLDCNATSLVEEIIMYKDSNATLSVCLPHRSGYAFVAGGGELGGPDMWTVKNSTGSTVVTGKTPFFGTLNCPAVPCPQGQQLVSLIMLDSYGDTWNGNQLTVSSCNQTVLYGPVTLKDGHIEGRQFCLPPLESGIRVNVGGGLWQNEVKWTLLDNKGSAVLTGGAPFVGDLECPEIPCPGNDWNLRLYDAAGNGWSGNQLQLTTCGGKPILSQVSLDSGNNNTVDLCIDKSPGYAVMVGGGSWQDEVSWTLSDENDSTVFTGSSPFYDSYNCTTVCNNIDVGASSTNTRTVNTNMYNPVCSAVRVNTDYPNATDTFNVTVRGNQLVVRRTDKTTGWNMLLELSCCPQASCSTDDVHWSVVMTDSYGDGWNGHEMVISDCSGNAVVSGLSLAQGKIGGVNLCLPKQEQSGFRVQLGTGSYPQEVAWYVLDSNHKVILNGNAYESEVFGCPEVTLTITSPIERIVEYRAAQYGPAPPLNLQGDLFFAGDACSPLVIPAHLIMPIAVAVRGNCPFVNKTRNAQYAGAKAIIIANYAESYVIISTPPGFNETFSIPTLGVLQSVGTALQQLIANYSSVSGSFTNQVCETVVIGSSTQQTKTARTSLNQAVCSNTRVNTDYSNSGDRFVVDVHGTFVTATRVDETNGWGMNLMFRCCESIVTATPSASPSNPPSPTMSPTISVSASASPDHSSSSGPNLGAVVAVPIVCAAVFFSVLVFVFRRGYVTRALPTRFSKPLMNEDSAAVAAAYPMSVRTADDPEDLDAM